jgi:hypothetical protein
MLRRVLMSAILMVGFCFSMSAFTPALASAAGHCDKSSAFDIIPRWYKYLDNKLDDKCNFTDFQWGDIWKIALAVLEMLLRVAGLVAFVYTVFGGFKFVLSRGNPQEAAKARQTIIDAIIGMAIALTATVLVAFLGRALTQ